MKDNHPNYSEGKKSMAIKSYFLSYAQFWREKATPEFEISVLKRAHTPQKFRAIGPLYNQNEFYENYHIDGNSRYFISEQRRIRIW
jgi:predicted metalloendopeptidase